MEHYRSLAIEPVEYGELNKLSFLEASVVKYVTRHSTLHNLEDLRKAQHCLELLAHLGHGERLRALDSGPASPATQPPASPPASPPFE